MKSIQTVLVMMLMLLCLNSAKSCDGCNGNIGSSFGSLLNINNSSFISMQWSGVSYHTRTSLEDPASDQFNTYQLIGRLGLGHGFSAQVNLPYADNQRDNHHGFQTISGLGDIQVGLIYNLFAQDYESTTLYSEVGASVKMPSGKYENSLHNIDLPQNFNLGTGSFGYGLNASLSYRGDNSGLVLSGAYMYMAPSQNGYKFGNTSNVACTAFVKKNLYRSVDLIGSTGLKFENQTKERFGNGNVVSSSGGRGLFIPITLGVAYKSFTMQCSYNVPVQQNYINNELEVFNKIDLQFVYFLN